MNNIRTLEPLHMTLNTTVIRALGQSYRISQIAALLLVAYQALLTKVGGSFSGRWNLMGVVARRAAKAALALAETATFFHLFHLPYEFSLLLFRQAVDREEIDQRKPRTIFEFVAAEAIDPVVALQVTLFADSRSKRGLEMPRIDDCQVTPIDQLLTLRVQFARTVAAFATNRMALEDRLFISVQRVNDRFDTVGMTKQTVRHDWPIEVHIANIIPRRNVPPILLAIPCDRRLEQSVVVLNEVRDSSRARTDRVFHFAFDLRQDTAFLVYPGLAVNKMSTAALNGVAGGTCLECVRAIGPKFSDGDWRQRASHRVAAK